MSGMCVVSIEGVLSAGWDLRQSPPTKWARTLYDALHSQYLMIGFTQAAPELVKWWMKRESLHEWSALMTQEAYLDYPQWKIRQVEDFLAEGWQVDLMIDIDPYVLEEVTGLGVLTLTMQVPEHPVGWKPPKDESVRAWTNVVESL